MRNFTLIFKVFFSVSTVSVLTMVPSTQSAFAGKPFLSGHNLIPTTYTLESHEWAVGTYVLGYGISDKLMLGVCPGLMAFYNMLPLQLKYGQEILSQEHRMSVEIVYFKTFNYGLNLFDMESVMSRLGLSHRFNDGFTLHGALDYFYYFSERRPFSLRLQPRNSDKFNISPGVLLEARLTKHFGTLIEFGVLGANYTFPYFNWGTSLNYKWSTGYVQFGFSQSSAYIGTGTDSSGASTYQLDQVWHPEIQIQSFL